MHASSSSPPKTLAVKDVHAPMRAFIGYAVLGVPIAAMMGWAVLDLSRVGAGSIAAGLVFYGVAMCVAGVGFVRSYRHGVFGFGNMVTLLRLTMVAVLVVALASGSGQSWPLFIFALVALSLDGVDGWLARRQNLASSFGARFDMEVDAIFALVLALMAFTNGVVGGFVLLLGVPSYIFFLAKSVFPWLDNPLPDLFSRKVVCVAQLAVLIALQIPVDLAGLIGPLTVMVAAALVWSFGRDIIWLARTHR